ncbi:MAG: TIGR01777 family protein [Acidimicrobiia bacterium]|nr:TIGR01777 family protein [Acidimicrobiia bacterium]
MDVLVAGSSGFIGSALLPALTAAGHRPVRALRLGSIPTGVDAIAWDPAAGVIDSVSLEGIGAVINLAGVGIGDRRWTPARKQEILESRTASTRLLATTMSGLATKPAVFVSGSAIGYYGGRGDEVLTEESAPGDDFLADVCLQWEAAAQPAADAGIRVVTTRTGIVLGRDGGVLKRLLLPFRLGLGGRVASGDQWMSWISLDDEVAAILHTLRTESLRGPVNLTAPNPATNSELTEALGKAVHRPTVLPTPLAPLKIRYGAELVEHLLVKGQRVLPKALQASGFTFQHATLPEALRAILG